MEKITTTLTKTFDLPLLIAALSAFTAQFCIHYWFADWTALQGQWFNTMSIPTLWLLMFGGYCLYAMPRTKVWPYLVGILGAGVVYVGIQPYVTTMPLALHAYGAFGIMAAVSLCAMNHGQYPLTEKFGKTIRIIGELVMCMSLAMALLIAMIAITVTLFSTLGTHVSLDGYFTGLIATAPFLAWFIMEKLSPTLRFAPVIARLAILPLTVTVMLYLGLSLVSMETLLHSREQLAVFPAVLSITLCMRYILHFDDKPQTYFMTRALEICMSVLSVFGVIGTSVAIYRISWLGMSEHRFVLALTVALLTTHVISYTIDSIKTRMLGTSAPHKLSFLTYYVILCALIAGVFPLVF